MKRILQLLSPVAVLLCFGCADPSLDRLNVLRFAEQAGGYKMEHGLLSKEGFIPAGSIHYQYADGEYSAAEIRAVNGKCIMPLAQWVQVERYCRLKRSKETVNLGGVPHVFVVQ